MQQEEQQSTVINEIASVSYQTQRPTIFSQTTKSQSIFLFHNQQNQIKQQFQSIRSDLQLSCYDNQQPNLMVPLNEEYLLNHKKLNEKVKSQDFKLCQIEADQILDLSSISQIESDLDLEQSISPSSGLGEIKNSKRAPLNRSENQLFNQFLQQYVPNTDTFNKSFQYQQGLKPSKTIRQSGTNSFEFDGHSKCQNQILLGQDEIPYNAGYGSFLKEMSYWAKDLSFEDEVHDIWNSNLEEKETKNQKLRLNLASIQTFQANLSNKNQQLTEVSEGKLALMQRQGQINYQYVIQFNSGQTLLNQEEEASEFHKSSHKTMREPKKEEPQLKQVLILDLIEKIQMLSKQFIGLAETKPNEKEHLKGQHSQLNQSQQNLINKNNSSLFNRGDNCQIYFQTIQKAVEIGKIISLNQSFKRKQKLFSAEQFNN